jgi:hypothetical protein
MAYTHDPNKKTNHSPPNNPRKTIKEKEEEISLSLYNFIWKLKKKKKEQKKNYYILSTKLKNDFLSLSLSLKADFSHSIIHYSFLKLSQNHP